MYSLSSKTYSGLRNTWITADVTALYTVIPHDLARLAVSWFLNTYSEYSITLKDFLLSAVTYLLKHNFFMFDSSFYLQATGASMGARFYRRLQIFIWLGGSRNTFSLA